MSTVRELHNRAMKLAQLAMVARNTENLERAEALANEAYELESQAAYLVPESQASEPTRSILFRSAASLAYQAKAYDVALKLVLTGLVGHPPRQIEQELNNLYDQIRYERQLQERIASVAEYGLEITMRGDAVGTGSIPYSEFKKRVDGTKQLIDRTVQRLMGQAYQGKGNAKFRPFSPVLEAPREGSFIITLKLERSTGQQPLFFDANQVIDQIINGIQMVNNDEEQKLKDLMDGSLGYFRHFVTTTQDIAPDGKKISFVGFKSQLQNVTLTKTQSEIEIPQEVENAKLLDEPQTITISGVLDFVTERKGTENTVGLTTEEGTEYDILVQEGMEDLVESRWKQYITIEGMYYQKRNLVHLLRLYSDE
jgi:hypothetical protein